MHYLQHLVVTKQPYFKGLIKIMWKCHFCWHPSNWTEHDTQQDTWGSPCEKGTYHLGEQWRFRQACTSRRTRITNHTMVRSLSHEAPQLYTQSDIYIYIQYLLWWQFSSCSVAFFEHYTAGTRESGKFWNNKKWHYIFYGLLTFFCLVD